MSDEEKLVIFVGALVVVAALALIFFASNINIHTT